MHKSLKLFMGVISFLPAVLLILSVLPAGISQQNAVTGVLIILFITAGMGTVFLFRRSTPAIFFIYLLTAVVGFIGGLVENHLIVWAWVALFLAGFNCRLYLKEKNFERIQTIIFVFALLLVLIVGLVCPLPWNVK